MSKHPFQILNDRTFVSVCQGQIIKQKNSCCAKNLLLFKNLGRSIRNCGKSCRKWNKIQIGVSDIPLKNTTSIDSELHCLLYISKSSFFLFSSSFLPFFFISSHRNAIYFNSNSINIHIKHTPSSKCIMSYHSIVRSTLPTSRLNNLVSYQN